METEVTDRAVKEMPRYKAISNWGLIPQGMSFAGDATSVAVDSEDNVFVFNRGHVPVIIFDRQGNYAHGWGEGEFDRPHGIVIDDDDNLYLVDTGGHFVQKRRRDGEPIFTIGVRGQPAEVQSGAFFNRPTDVVVHPGTHELYISDGYGNSRVHRFDPDGRHIASFGEPGADDGQFSLPHGIELLDSDTLLVCDRENFRIQIFSTGGDYIGQWHAHHPSAIRLKEGFIFVAELGVAMQYGVPNTGCRVCVLDLTGRQLGHFGAATPGFTPSQFFAPHGLAIDSQGDVYVAEVNHTYMTSVLRQPWPKGDLISLRKWQLNGPSD